jgi:hypothetical protein
VLTLADDAEADLLNDPDCLPVIDAGNLRHDLGRYVDLTNVGVD